MTTTCKPLSFAERARDNGNAILEGVLGGDSGLAEILGEDFMKEMQQKVSLAETQINEGEANESTQMMNTEEFQEFMRLTLTVDFKKKSKAI